MRRFFLIMMLLFAAASMIILFVADMTMPEALIDKYFYLSHICLGMAVIFAACYFVLLGKGK